MSLAALGPAKPLVLAGSPRKQGIEHGRRARQEILANLNLVRRGMLDLAARGRSYDYEGLLARNEAFVQREAPEILEEVQGIGEGAEVPYRDLLLLNLPLYFVGILMPLECSQILVAPPATADGRIYLAKTRDLSRGRLEHVVLHRRYDDGRELIEVGAAGSITWPGSGINSDGLALSTSGVWSKRTVIDLDRAARGWLLINSHLLLRDSRSVDDLAERLSAQPRVTGLNLVATDRHAAAAFEATADRVYRQEAEGGILVRTNHFLTPEIRRLAPTPEEHPSSYHRYQVAVARLRQQHGQWDSSRLAGLLADHNGYPQLSICRHAQNGEGADTIYASIASLPEGELWSTLDNPCKSLTPDQPAAE